MTSIPTLYNHLMREKQDFKRIFHFFLCSTLRDESPAAILQGETDVLKHCFGMCCPKNWPNEDACRYKVRIDMCTGTEHVFVEALHGQSGWPSPFNMPPGCITQDFYDREWCGSFSGRPIDGPHVRGLMETWVEQTAWLTNEDGSYFTESQLRHRFRAYMERRYDCGGTLITGLLMLYGKLYGRRFEEYSCRQKCIALPGDTIYWKFDDPYRVVTRWETATDEELSERGWLQHGGMLVAMCKNYREDMERGGDSGNDTGEE